MPAMHSDPGHERFALRIALSLALALVAAEAADLGFTFVAGLVAATLASAPGLRWTTLLLTPLLAWVLISMVAVLLGAVAGWAPLAFMLIVVAGLWAGFDLSTRPRLATVGLMLLVFFAIAPMRLHAYPEAAEAAVNDIARNVLVAALAVGLVGLVLPPPPPHRAPPVRAPLDPFMAALALTIIAFAVWVLEPPAPGAVLVGAVIALRADASPPGVVARDRLVAAVAGGAGAVVVATLVALAHGLPMLFVATLAAAWPMALAVAEGGAWRGAGAKSLNALAILTGEGFSPLFEDTEERLGIRIAGVVIGLALAILVLRLAGRSAERRAA